MDPDRIAENVSKRFVNPNWVFNPAMVPAWQHWDERSADLQYVWGPGGYLLLLILDVVMTILVPNRWESTGAIMIGFLAISGIVVWIRAWRHNRRPPSETMVNIAARQGEMLGMEQVRQARIAAIRARNTVSHLDTAAQDYLAVTLFELDRAVYQVYQIAQSSENAMTLADLRQRVGDITKIAADMRELSSGDSDTNIKAMTDIVQRITEARLVTSALRQGQLEIAQVV